MNDDPLHNAFRALRDDDARHAPSFDALADPTSPSPLQTALTPHRSTATRVSDFPRRSLWPWQLALGGSAATAILLAFHLAANNSPAPAPDSLASNEIAAVSDQLTPDWSTPSDTLLADTTTSAESTAALIRDIDRLLQTPSPL